MSITEKFIRDIAQFFRYSTDSDPTTQQEFQEAMKNWIKTEEAIVDVTLWQPTTVYSVGNIVRTPSLASQYILECTTAGTSGIEEPDYSGANVGTVVTDGTAEWTIKQYAVSDKYLPLTGGVIQGNLSIQSSDIARGTTPSSNQFLWLPMAIDKNRNVMGGIYKLVSSGNVSATRMFDYPNNDNTSNGDYIGIEHDANGNVYTHAPTPSQTDNSTNIATTAYVKGCVPESVGSKTKFVYTNSNGVITESDGTVGSATQPVYLKNGAVTKCTYSLNKTVPSNAVFTDTNNISASGSNYIRFNTGIQICWGSSSASSAGVSVTFPKAFSTAPLVICGGGGYANTFGNSSVSTTKFKITCSTNATGHWIAIGKWA